MKYCATMINRRTIMEQILDIRRSFILLFVLYTICTRHIDSSKDPTTKHTTFILVGSTGDLAKKYLWQSFFNLFLKHQSMEQTFTFCGCGRSSAEVGSVKLDSILNNTVFCDGHDSNCLTLQRQFISQVSYMQLKTDSDYSKLGKLLMEKKNDDIIFYLSIPPEGFSATAENIHKCCHLRKQFHRRFRVVFEKPFGHDLLSAKNLIYQMSKYFEEKEILRVDHYLGKSIVREIVPFRVHNPHIEEMLNRDYVDRVEIVLKETIDAKGRISYYNDNGVIRDILQNHLMEVMTLIAMDVSSNSKDISRLKLKLLKQVENVKASALLIGQYSDYLSQSLEETPEFKLSKYIPTFSAALLKINSAKWLDVPFILMSGKSLNERTSYARIVFKKNNICVSECSTAITTPQIIFHIGKGKSQLPMIYLTKNFLNITFPSKFTTYQSQISEDDVLFGQDISKFNTAVLSKNLDAYTAIVEDIFFDVRENFVGSDRLETMWNIWNEVLEGTSLLKPRIYDTGDKDNRLDFHIIGSKLKFQQDAQQFKEGASGITMNHQTPNTYLGQKLICSSTKNVVHLLVEHIAKSVKKRLLESPYFHIAFSGGKTPVIVFKELAQKYSDLPWDKIHLWQVDERCVDMKDKDSNFGQLEKYLIQYVHIPYRNIHPMPVRLKGHLCDVLIEPSSFYQADIQYHIEDEQFDYILLGVGKDGHTASLFPHSDILDSKNLVTMTTGGKGKRMTLTFNAINNARHISIIVTGKDKHDIIHTLEYSPSSFQDFPILGVNGAQMTWFMDYNTFFDTDAHI